MFILLQKRGKTPQGRSSGDSDFHTLGAAKAKERLPTSCRKGVRNSQMVGSEEQRLCGEL